MITGNVTDDTRVVAEAVRGQDAVISTLGVGNSLKSSNLISRSTRTIVNAMESQGVRRLIFVSAFGVGDTRHDAPLLPRIMSRLLLADIFADKKAGEDYLRRSALDWTLVYPVLLTNGPRTAKYRVGERLDLHGLPKISRADVAEFVLRQLEDTTYLGKVAVISKEIVAEATLGDIPNEVNRRDGPSVFVGHYGVSFVAKKSVASIPLWVLFIAVQFLDVAWAPLVLLGIEKVRIVPGITASNPLDLYYMPYTHSLVAALLWSAGAFFIYRLALGRDGSDCRARCRRCRLLSLGARLRSSPA